MHKISFTADQISNILGEKISDKQVKDVLTRYGIEHEETSGSFMAAIPLSRPDLVIPEDMAEEMGRVLGYDQIKPKLPKIDFKPQENEAYQKISKIRAKFLEGGYSEVMTYAFKEKGEIEVLESASDKKALRINLTDGLTESLKLNKLNAPLLGLKEVKIFEIGTVWTPEEEIHVAYNEKDKIIEKTINEY